MAASFKIDGDEYPIPGLESFNMDEAVILYECSGLTLEDFAIDEDNQNEVEELEDKTKNPGFIKALMVVAYMRGNKKSTKKRAMDLMGNSNLFEALQSFLDSEEDPTEPQKSEEATSLKPVSTDLSGGSSGSDGQKSLDLVEETLRVTGTSA